MMLFTEDGVTVKENDIIELAIHDTKNIIEYIIVVLVEKIDKSIHFKNLKILQAPANDCELVSSWDVDLDLDKEYRKLYLYKLLGDKTTHPEYFL